MARAGFEDPRANVEKPLMGYLLNNAFAYYALAGLIYSASPHVSLILEISVFLAVVEIFIGVNSLASLCAMFFR